MAVKKKIVPNPAGRKSTYDEKVKPHLELIAGWCKQGATEEIIRKKLNVSNGAWGTYKNQHLELKDVLKKNKEFADIEVESSLYKRAIGYDYWEVHELPDGSQKKILKEVSPDTTAQIFWLKNRRPDLWRDKQQVEHTGAVVSGINIRVTIPDEVRNLLTDDRHKL